MFARKKFQNDWNNFCLYIMYTSKSNFMIVNEVFINNFFFYFLLIMILSFFFEKKIKPEVHSSLLKKTEKPKMFYWQFEQKRKILKYKNSIVKNI